MSIYEPTETLDVKGLSRPVPVVETRGAADELESGEILQIVATDSDGISDPKGWTDATDGVTMLNQEEVEEDDDTIFRHLIQKG